MDCKICGKKVEGEILRSEGYVYHSECFLCSVCNLDLGSKTVPFMTDENHVLFCAKDYNE